MNIKHNFYVFTMLSVSIYAGDSIGDIIIAIDAAADGYNIEHQQNHVIIPKIQKYLKEYNVNDDTDGNQTTLLHQAALANLNIVVQFLINRGARVNAENKYHFRPIDTYIALWQHNSHEKNARLRSTLNTLISHGARRNTNMLDYIEHISSGAIYAMLEHFIQSPAIKNANIAIDEYGNTPLHVIVAKPDLNQHIPALTPHSILSCNSPTNKHGNTITQIARDAKNTDAIDIMHNVIQPRGQLCHVLPEDIVNYISEFTPIENHCINYNQPNRNRCHIL